MRHLAEMLLGCRFYGNKNLEYLLAYRSGGPFAGKSRPLLISSLPKTFSLGAIYRPSEGGIYFPGRVQ